MSRENNLEGKKIERYRKEENKLKVKEDRNEKKERNRSYNETDVDLSILKPFLGGDLILKTTSLYLGGGGSWKPWSSKG